MLRCSRCGFANLDERERCLKCQSLLRHQERLEEKSARVRRLDLSGLQRRALGFWHRLTDWARPTLPANLPHRRPATAAVLSLIPGLGQNYNRQALKAVWFLLGWAGLLAIALWTFFESYAYLTLAAWLLFWIWIANDALSTANRINGQVWSPRQAWAGFFAIITMVAVVWFAALLVISPLVYFRMVGPNNFAPLFQTGDFIWLDKWCLWFGGAPRRGEHIYYDPAGFTMHRGNNAFFYDAQNFIGRVIGLPGETVTVQNASPETRIWINGQPLSPSLYPPGTEWLPEFREFHVPPDRWLILQTQTMEEGFTQLIGGPQSNPAPSLSGLDLDPQKSWTNSNYVSRDQMIGRVFAISHPPERRRWFVRGEVEP